ncbi:MAG: putative lipid II flippase FtsW [Chloroflexi bacterium]|nr:putative lipid II flippase FtsW [Chloroflexota bacterium]
MHQLRRVPGLRCPRRSVSFWRRGARPRGAPVNRRIWAGIDTTFLLAVGLLLVIGVAMVYSASFVVAHNEFGDAKYFLVRHVAWIGLGFMILLIVSRLDYHVWQRVAVPLYALTLILLAAVMIPGLGDSAYGASRWLDLGPLPSIQPSELAKVAVVVYLSSWIARVGTDINKLTIGTIPFVIILALSAGLVLVEPDLGTTIVLAMTAASVFFIAGANLIQALLGAVACGLFLINFVVNAGYRADRIQAFLNPWSDPTGIGWQTTQSLLALGSGGLSGLGLGASRQKHYYLPNAHTDSIFAIIGEEIGFIGTALVLGLFLVIAWRGLRVAAAARDPFGRALAAGATLLIVWQGMLNMAVVSHVVPLTGIPLPFISYGGSAMVASLAAVGIVLSVSRTTDPQRLSWRALFTAEQAASQSNAATPGRAHEARDRRGGSAAVRPAVTRRRVPTRQAPFAARR